MNNSLKILNLIKGNTVLEYGDIFSPYMYLNDETKDYIVLCDIIGKHNNEYTKKFRITIEDLTKEK